MSSTSKGPLYTVIIIYNHLFGKLIFGKLCYSFVKWTTGQTLLSASKFLGVLIRWLWFLKNIGLYTKVQWKRQGKFIVFHKNRKYCPQWYWYGWWEKPLKNLLHHFINKLHQNSSIWNRKETSCSSSSPSAVFFFLNEIIVSNE